MVDYINKIDTPNKVCYVRSFMGLVNYYRDMWRKHTNTLATLNKLCYTKVDFERTEVE